MTLWRNISPVIQQVTLIPGIDPTTVYPGHCVDLEKNPNPKFFKPNDLYVASKGGKRIPPRIANPQVRPENQKELISIIIPTKNCAEYLDRMLASVFKQDYPKKEIIIVDDGSEDKTRSVIQPIAGKISKFLSYHPGRGSNYARNIGFKISRGEFVIFCDSDTVLNPSMLSMMKQSLDYDPGASFAYCKYNRIEETTKKSEIVGGGDWDVSRLRSVNYIDTASLIRRADVPLENGKPFDEKLKRFQDYDLWLGMADKKKRGVFINAILFESWIRKDSITNVESESEALKYIRKKHGI